MHVPTTGPELSTEHAGSIYILLYDHQYYPSQIYVIYIMCITHILKLNRPISPIFMHSYI